MSRRVNSLLFFINFHHSKNRCRCQYRNRNSRQDSRVDSGDRIGRNAKIDVAPSRASSISPCASCTNACSRTICLQVFSNRARAFALGSLSQTCTSHKRVGIPDASSFASLASRVDLLATVMFGSPSTRDPSVRYSSASMFFPSIFPSYLSFTNPLRPIVKNDIPL